MLVPGPIGNDERVMLGPFQDFFSHDRPPLPTHDKIDRAGGMAVPLGLLARPQHLNPTAERRQGRTSGDGIHKFKGDSVIRTSGHLTEAPKLSLSILPAIAHRKVLSFSFFPDRPHRSGPDLKVFTLVLFHRLNPVSWIRLIKRYVQAEDKRHIESVRSEK